MKTKIEIAIEKLENAMVHRVRIGKELTPESSSMFVQWYEDALEIENTYRKELGEVIIAEKKSQLFNAYASGEK